MKYMVIGNFFNKKFFKCIGIGALCFLVVGLMYLFTLCYPQPFFKYKTTIEQITIYSDEEINQQQMSGIINTALQRVEKSVIYPGKFKQNIFIANNPLRWLYFSNVNHKASGLSYVALTHPIFFRRVDIENNRLYGNTGKVAGGDRTLDYFIAHELTHYLEFKSMKWYQYPLKTNWVIEGYCEYIAHNSQSYETALNFYQNGEETVGAKYYTRVRTMVTYLLEKENLQVHELWAKVSEYDKVLSLAIP